MLCTRVPGIAMKLQSGQVLSGTLRLVRRIADGGMGSVWIAEHLVLGTEVAVKVMARAWADMPGAHARFLREARLTARIESPHVVRVLDCRLTESDEPYLVLELLRGETLEARVRRRGPLPVSELLVVVEQTCEALGAAHAASILHRDLKPENVFLVAGPTPFVKLLDFGVAKPKDPAEQLEADRLPAGTPQYMSPEQLFEPESADERADLFSLAAVAYFALTGRAPFPADSLEGLYFAVDAGAFEPPTKVRPELPAAVDAVFARALAHDPAARFPSARALAEALADAFTTRALPAAAAEDDEEAAPESGWSVAEPDAVVVAGVPRRRLRRASAVTRIARRAASVTSRYGAVVAVLLLAAGLAWRSPAAALGADASPHEPAAAATDGDEGAVPSPAVSIGPPRPTPAAPPARPRRLRRSGHVEAAPSPVTSVASPEESRSRIQSILTDVPRPIERVPADGEADATVP